MNIMMFYQQYYELNYSYQQHFRKPDILQILGYMTMTNDDFDKSRDTGLPFSDGEIFFMAKLQPCRVFQYMQT